MCLYIKQNNRYNWFFFYLISLGAVTLCLMLSLVTKVHTFTSFKLLVLLILYKVEVIQI